MITILANGEFPVHPAAVQALLDGEKLICCDGAADKLADSGLRIPDVVIGDMDSTSRVNQNFWPSAQFIQVSEQETNDLSKAFRFCQKQGWKEVSIVGAGGLREDHMIGNVALLADFAGTGCNVSMITNYGTFLPCQAGLNKFKAIPGQQISIFALDSNTRLTTGWLKYPLNEQCLPRLWNGTLNEATGQSFTIRASGGIIPPIIFITHFD